MMHCKQTAPYPLRNPYKLYNQFRSRLTWVLMDIFVILQGQRSHPNLQVDNSTGKKKRNECLPGRRGICKNNLKLARVHMQNILKI